VWPAAVRGHGWVSAGEARLYTRHMGARSGFTGLTADQPLWTRWIAPPV